MKKIYAIIVLAIAAIAGTANAAEKGFYVGGSLGFEHNDKKSDVMSSYNEFIIAPEDGYNFNSKWAFGGTVSFDYKNFFRVDDTYSSVFSIEPYARYTYFRQGILQLFVDGGFGIGIGGGETGGHDTDTLLTYSIGFKPGVSLNFTKNFGLTAHLGFLGYKGANNAAYDLGYVRNGGFFFHTSDVLLGAYFNF